MFKHIIKLFIITVLCLACEEDDPVPAPAPFLEISKEELIQNLGPEGGSRTVTVTANQEYTATPSQPWCAVAVSKNYFVISVPENKSTGQRTAAVTVSSKDLPDITLTVTQAGSSPFLKISETELIQDFEMEGGDKIVTVTTNQKYTVASSHTWCYVAVLNDGFRISVPRNEGFERTARILVTSKDLPDITIVVTQAGITPAISVKESDIWVQCGIREFTLTVTTNVPIVFELPEWIQEKAGNPSGTGTHKFTFIASAFTTSHGNIVIKAVDDETVRMMVPVVQQEVLDIKAMTFNVRVQSSGDGNNNWPYRKNVAAQIIKDEAVDVVGTQEMSKTILGVNQFGDLKTLLSADYDSYGYGRDESSISDEYNAIFYKKSRFTLINSGVFWLSATPGTKSIGWDAAYRRIAVWTILEDKTGGQRFFAINTHLDNVGATARLESVKLILDRISSLSEGLPVILMGDFNAVPTSDPIQYLANSTTPGYLMHAKDIAESRSGPNWTIHDYGATPVSQRIFIDYIFVSQQSQVIHHSVLPEKLNDIFLSDHCPVTARILLIKRL